MLCCHGPFLVPSSSVHLVNGFNWGNDMHSGVNFHIVLLFFIDFFPLKSAEDLPEAPTEMLQAPVLPSDPRLHVLHLVQGLISSCLYNHFVIYICAKTPCSQKCYKNPSDGAVNSFAGSHNLWATCRPTGV